MSKTIKALVLIAFDDATTGDRFAQADTPTLSQGAFDNFETAGLVRKANPTVKVKGNTLKTSGDLTVKGDLTVPAKPAPRKRQPRSV